MRTSRLVALLILAAGASLAAAKPAFLKAFMAAYNISPNSKIGMTRCLICHQPPGPPNRNPYGLAVQAAQSAAQSRMVTAEILRGVENENAGDGVAFITK